MTKRLVLLLAILPLTGQQIATAQSQDDRDSPGMQTSDLFPAEPAGYFDADAASAAATPQYVPWSHSASPQQPPFQEAAYPLPDDPQTEFLEAEMRFVDEEEKAPSLSAKRGDKEQAPIKLYTYWSPQQNLSTQPGDFTLNGFGGKFAAPISMQEGRLWIATTNFERLEIGSSAILPDSGRAMPDELWEINFGVLHMRDLDNGWKTGGMLNLGTASDQPFDNTKQMTLSAMGFLNIPWHNDRDSWNFSLFYSPTAQIEFPIPGIAYVWRPNDQLEMNIGVPFSLTYRPTERRTLSFTYTPLTNVNLILEQELGAKLTLYGGYSINNEIYLLSGRPNDDERFYIFDQRLKIGLRRDIAYGFSADLSAAYLFDRQIFQADDFSSDRRDEIGIDPGALLSFSVSWSR
ncbi:MAG: DUF6268 family outer membrane beta-barrel protein [Blastopirellula sp. JB062]